MGSEQELGELEEGEMWEVRGPETDDIRAVAAVGATTSVSTYTAATVNYSAATATTDRITSRRCAFA